MKQFYVTVWALQNVIKVLEQNKGEKIMKEY